LKLELEDLNSNCVVFKRELDGSTISTSDGVLELRLDIR
jgi:hypothetical protein